MYNLPSHGSVHPESEVKANNSANWFNVTIRYKLNCIHRLIKKAKHHPSVTNQQKLDKLELELQDVMNTTESECEYNLIQEFALSKYKVS